MKFLKIFLDASENQSDGLKQRHGKATGELTSH